MDRRILSSAPIALMLFVNTLCRSDAPKMATVECYGTSSTPSAVAVGDVVFFRTSTWRGRFVTALQLGGEDFAHVGIVVDIENSVRIVHASPVGEAVVRIEELKKLMTRAEITSVALYRPQVSVERKIRAASIALRYARRQIPFDYRFSSVDDRAIYCTELIMLCYPSSREGKARDPSDIVFPHDLLRSRSLRPLACGPDGSYLNLRQAERQRREASARECGVFAPPNFTLQLTSGLVSARRPSRLGRPIPLRRHVSCTSPFAASASTAATAVPLCRREREAARS
jgi:hypothetical protein